MTRKDTSHQKESLTQAEAKIGYGRTYYGWRIVAISFLSMMLSYGMILNCMGQFIVPITEEMGYSKAIMSFCFGLVNFGSILSSVLVARCIERFGPKKSMAACAAVITMGIFLFSVVDQLWQFFIAAAMIGLAFIGIATLPVAILINDWFRSKQKGFATSLAFMGSGFGGMIFNPLIGILISAWGWRWAYAFMAVVVLVIYIPLVLAVVRSAPEERADAEDRKEESEVLQKPSDGKHGAEELSQQGFLQDKTFWVLCLAVTLLCGVGNSVMQYCVPYFMSCGFTQTRASLGMSADMAMLAFGKLLLGWYCDHGGVKSCSWKSMLCMSAGVVVLLFSARWTALWMVFALFFGVGSGSVTVCIPLIVDKLFGRARYTRALGIVSVFIGTGNAVVPILVGACVDRWGNYDLAWSLLAGMCLLATGLFAACFRMQQRNL